MVEQQGGEPADYPRLLHSLRVESLSVADLTAQGVLAHVGLTLADATGPDHAPTQRVGAAIFAVGHQGLLVPSAAGAGLLVIAAFPDRFAAGTVTVTVTVDLHAWAAPRLRPI